MPKILDPLQKRTPTSNQLPAALLQAALRARAAGGPGKGIVAGNTQGLAQSGGGGGYRPSVASAPVSTLAAFANNPIVQDLIKKGIIREGMPPEQIQAILAIQGMSAGVPVDIQALMAKIKGDYASTTGDILTSGADWMKDLYGTNFDPNDPNAALFAQDPLFSSYAGGLAQMGETADTNLATDLAYFEKMQAAEQAYYNELMAGISTDGIPVGGTAGGGGGGGRRGGRGRGGGGSGDGNWDLNDTKLTNQEQMRQAATSNLSARNPGFEETIMGLNPADEYQNFIWDLLQRNPSPAQFAEALVNERDALAGNINAAATTGENNLLFAAGAPGRFTQGTEEYMARTGMIPGDNPETPEIEAYYANPDFEASDIILDPTRTDEYSANQQMFEQAYGLENLPVNPAYRQQAMNWWDTQYPEREAAAAEQQPEAAEQLPSVLDPYVLAGNDAITLDYLQSINPQDIAEVLAANQGRIPDIEEEHIREWIGENAGGSNYPGYWSEIQDALSGSYTPEGLPEDVYPTVEVPENYQPPALSDEDALRLIANAQRSTGLRERGDYGSDMDRMSVNNFFSNTYEGYSPQEQEVLNRYFNSIGVSTPNATANAYPGEGFMNAVLSQPGVGAARRRGFGNAAANYIRGKNAPIQDNGMLREDILNAMEQTSQGQYYADVNAAGVPEDEYLVEPGKYWRLPTPEEEQDEMERQLLYIAQAEQATAGLNPDVTLAPYRDTLVDTSTGTTTLRNTADTEDLDQFDVVGEGNPNDYDIVDIIPEEQGYAGRSVPVSHFRQQKQEKRLGKAVTKREPMKKSSLKLAAAKNLSLKAKKRGKGKF